jgi:hypothetical protein
LTRRHKEKQSSIMFTPPTMCPHCLSMALLQCQALSFLSFHCRTHDETQNLFISHVGRCAVLSLPAYMTLPQAHLPCCARGGGCSRPRCCWYSPRPPLLRHPGWHYCTPASTHRQHRLLLLLLLVVVVVLLLLVMLVRGLAGATWVTAVMGVRSWGHGLVHGSIYHFHDDCSLHQPSQAARTVCCCQTARKTMSPS